MNFQSKQLLHVVKISTEQAQALVQDSRGTTPICENITYL
jgi:hypothetical protein